MKDENNDILMTEFVGFRAKMYVVRMDGKKDIKKVKGGKNNIVGQTIMFDDYKRCTKIRIKNRSEFNDTSTNDTSYQIQRTLLWGRIPL